MLYYVVPTPLPRDSDARFLRLAPRCLHLRRGFVQDQLFTNGQILINHSFIQSSLTLGHRNGFNSPTTSKLEYPGLIRGRFLYSVPPRSSSAGTSDRSGDENPITFESLEGLSGVRSSIRNEKESDGNGAPVLTTFDFLELKRELEKEEDAGAGSMEELMPEDSEETTSSSEKEEIVVGNSVVRGGRRVMRRSNLLAKQVISMESARNLGFVSQLWVDTNSWAVALVEVRPNFLSGDTEKFLLEDVYQVGDVVLVPNESVMENELNMTGLDTLVGYDVVKPGRRNIIGKIRGYTFDINAGSVESLEFDSFGFSIIPSSLVSTYRLSVEDVLNVKSDKVIVYEEAFSHVQRLTKGIWDSGKIGESGDHLEASHDFRRKRAYADRRRSSRRFRSQKFSDGDDDWDLPMDY